ncbi:TetR/AcrR family transcriptional regulator [Paenibacillus harenae]|uniref:TetR/AcrR family transcriptional regulator n=1 Tax=Paenibacillus harenae TaxID=306543 RepID=UPI00146BE180|nr:TetR/AcrR family transcriptional regulator [Paenibacillus harenae]
MPKIVDHDKRKQLIADAMIRAINQVGLEKITVRKIAEEAGLSMGSVQYYFPAQHDLYIYAMELIAQRIKKRILSIARDDMPVEKKVIAIMKQLISSESADQKVEGEVWLSFSMMALRDAQLEALSHELFRTTRELLRKLLATLRDRQYLGAALDIELEAVNLHAFIDGITLQTIVYLKVFDETKIDELLMNYLHNLKRRSET